MVYHIFKSLLSAVSLTVVPRYTEEPENAELENAFDEAYKAEFEAYINAAKYIEYMTDGNIDFMTAKKMINTKRSELISILSA